MSERLPHPTDQPSSANEGVTDDWRPQTDLIPTPSENSPTATYDEHSTSGPNNSLRFTIAQEKTEVVEDTSRFPQLPGLKVVGYIDCGGMGHVYLAEQETPRRTVAVKIATSANRAGMVSRERFDREVQALAEINHPNIMPIYIAGDWHGFPYYAMRFMAGGPLTKQLPRLANNTTAMVQIMRKVAIGLQVLHENGIIHRDLKPLNILLDEHDEPVIADFGLAKWIDGKNFDLTVTSAALGTKYYMPPEQTLGLKETYGPGCDIWSFGVTLYEMLVGKRPFREELDSDIYDQIRNFEPPIPDTVPKDLATIITKCLQKLPEDRYLTATELSAELECVLAGMPIGTQMPVKKSKPFKRIYRRAILVGVGLGMVATVVALLILWPTPPVKRSISERLRAGETVTIIGENGLPENGGESIQGSAKLTKHPLGYCSLDSTEIATVRLVQEELTEQFVLSCDCAIIGAPSLLNYAGIMIASESHPLPNGNRNSSLQVIQQTRVINEKDGSATRIDKAKFILMNWTDKANGDINEVDQVEKATANSQARPITDTTIAWHKMEVRVDRSQLFVGWENERFPGNPYRLGDFGKLFPGPPFEPKSVTGFGLTVNGTSALFRNLVLTPFTPITQ